MTVYGLVHGELVGVLTTLLFNIHHNNQREHNIWQEMGLTRSLYVLT